LNKLILSTYIFPQLLLDLPESLPYPYYPSQAKMANSIPTVYADEPYPHRMPKEETIPSVYVKELYSPDRGTPLYVPTPSENSPEEYKRRGIHIGDVGVFRPDGSFDYFFSIAYPAQEPINKYYGVPDGFEVYEPLGAHHTPAIIPVNPGTTSAHNHLHNIAPLLDSRQASSTSGHDESESETGSIGVSRRRQGTYSAVRLFYDDQAQ
jgi:hypothetical protein